MNNSMIAYFDASNDIPEEIIMAAGYIPYKILGDVNIPSDSADRYLFKTFCPLSRSILTEALSFSSKWAGIVIAHGCDATNRQFDIWKRHVKTPYLYWFNTPMNTGKSALLFFKEEIEAFIDSIEQKYGTKITTEKLSKSINISNRIKKLLQKVGKLRRIRNITNVEYFDVVCRAFIEDKEQYILRLQSRIREFERRPGPRTSMKKIVLTGSDVTYPGFMQLLDNAGLRVIRDDLSIGERYYSTLISETDDPIKDLIQYHINMPRPPTKNPSDPRLEYLVRAFRDSGSDGLVSQNLKFCEPYAYDSVFICNSLKNQNIPVINLERDYINQPDHQFINRLEAFKELL